MITAVILLGILLIFAGLSGMIASSLDRQRRLDALEKRIVARERGLFVDRTV